MDEETERSETHCVFSRCSPAAPALRTPLSIAGSYASPFAMMGHHEMNGSLTSPGVYPGLISPQMSAAAAAAAAYGRSPIVTIFSPPCVRRSEAVHLARSRVDFRTTAPQQRLNYESSPRALVGYKVLLQNNF